MGGLSHVPGNVHIEPCILHWAGVNAGLRRKTSNEGATASGIKAVFDHHIIQR